MPQRTLTYFRTQWLDGAIPGYPNLESVVREVLRKAATVPATRITKKDGVVLEIRTRRYVVGKPVFIHIASHMPGAEGSIVPEASAEPSAPLETLAPPKNKNFLEGALAALITGDHCLLCTAGLTAAALRYYIYSMVRKTGLPSQALAFKLAPVANRKKVLEIVESGVAEIGLSGTMDELGHIPVAPRDRGRIEKAKMKLRESIVTLLGKDQDVAKLLTQDGSNVNAKLVVKFSKRGQGSLDQESFDEAAKQAVDEEDPGVYIRLRSGTIIDASNVKLTRRAEVRSFGNTIDHSDAWDELQKFYLSLQGDKFLT